MTSVEFEALLRPPAPMGQEIIFHVGARVIEAATVLRCSFLLLGYLRSREKMLISLNLQCACRKICSAWWRNACEMDQPCEELDLLRCRMTCRMWKVLYAVAMMRFLESFSQKHWEERPTTVSNITHVTS